MNVFQRALSYVEGFFTEAEKVVSAFVGAFIHNIAANGGPVLVLAAKDAVSAAEATGGSASVKLAAAQAAVIADLTSKGVTVVNSAINGAIEAAVAQLQADAAKK